MIIFRVFRVFRGFTSLVESESAERAMYSGDQMLEVAPKNCHFVPLYEPSGVILTSRISIPKPFSAKRI
jgi:hypothetical protein